MADLVVRRWQRYGKDRLYVATSDGVRVGWRDQQTGVVTVESSAHAAELEAVLAAWNAVAPAPEVEAPEVFCNNEQGLADTGTGNRLAWGDVGLKHDALDW